MGSCTKLRKRHTFVASGQGKSPCFLGSAVVETALPKNNTWGKERRNQREVLKCCGLVFNFGVVCVRVCVFGLEKAMGWILQMVRNVYFPWPECFWNCPFMAPAFSDLRCLPPLLQAHLGVNDNKAALITPSPSILVAVSISQTHSYCSKNGCLYPKYLALDLHDFISF